MLLRLNDLAKDRRGVVSIYFAFAITGMVLLAVAALDLLRVALVRSRVQAALDASVLAVGYNLTASRAEWEADGKAYFEANLGGSIMGATITPPVFDTSKSTTTTNRVVVTATATVPVMITGYTDAGAFELSMSTTARQTTRANVELVMAIDNTGSMAGSKMTAAKSAAKKVSAAMLGSTSGGNNYVGLVPFTETVNVGNSTATKAWIEDETGFSKSKWKGCLFERPDADGVFQVENTAPTNGHKFRAYRRTDPEYDQSGQTDNAKCNRTAGCKKVGDYLVYVDNNDQSGCTDSKTTFLTASKATIDNDIDDMDADGNTMIASGAMWGWRMLSPSWRGHWDSTSKQPFSHGAGVTKVLVLLSDGDNQVSSANRNPYMNVNDVKPWGEIAGTRDGDADNILWHDNGNPKNVVANYCESIKADGITIFTIPFGNGDDISANTERIMKGCATDANKYFRVTEETKLEGVFDTVVAAVSELVIEE